MASSFGSDDYVGAVLGGLPKEVTSSGGIPTEAAIRDRYKVTLGVLETQLFGGTQGRYDTDAILADDKVGIGYTMDSVTDANLTIISKKH